MAVLMHLLPFLDVLVALAAVIHAVFWGMTFRVYDGHVRVLVYGLTVRKVLVDEAADIKRDTRTNTVDLTLKVKERGKNTVQLSGKLTIGLCVM